MSSLRACLDATLLQVLLAPKPLGEVTGGGGVGGGGR